MSAWTRLSPLCGSSLGELNETWAYRGRDGQVQQFDLEVRVGKPLDVFGLKNISLEEIEDYSAFLRRTAQRLYGPDSSRRRVEQCPCCGTSTGEAREAMRAFDVAYLRCLQCEHVFVGEQPDATTLNSVFAESADHSSTYVDASAVEKRLREVVIPKANWAVDQFRRLTGRAPESCIDVGAGGGHFVEAMRRSSVLCDGWELSKASRQFAANAFGIDLLDADFLKTRPHPVDVVTMWGLLEYTPEPRRFLDVARKWLAPAQGLLVVEVPRYDAIGTAVQAQPDAVIARHMDPTTHVNCFSDASLSTALVECGFAPVAAWYFGMDAYELLVQMAIRDGNRSISEKQAALIPALQAACDSGRLCDDIVVAAKPLS